jgi:hypothetical protein
MKATPNLAWETAREIFEWDGSWRDLYVFGTTVLDWDRLLQALRASSFQIEFTQGGEPAALPKSFAEHFDAGPDRPLIMLSVLVDGVRLNAHMFCDDEIEFDIDPREISGPDRFGALVSFMNFAADALASTVVLAPENGPQHPLLVAHPGTVGVSQP